MRLAKHLMAMVLIIVASVCAGAVALVCVYALPTEGMFRHVKDDIAIYEAEGLYPNWAGLGASGRLDNFTDAIMLANAIHPVKGSLVDNAMINYKWGGKKDPLDTLIRHVQDEKLKDKPSGYPRYWHGYLTVLKPALMAYGPFKLRGINFYFQAILFLSVMWALYRRISPKHAIAYAVVIMILNLVTTSLSFQFSSVFYISMLLTLLILYRNNKIRERGAYPYVFLVTGILTSYFDLLTYPLFTLGFPLLVAWLMNCESENTLPVKNVLTRAAVLSASWMTGYVGMWAGKWIIASLLTGQNVIKNALHSVAVRSSTTVTGAASVRDISIFSPVINTIRTCTDGPIRVAFIAALIALIYIMVTRRKQMRPIRKNTKWILCFCAALPFAWYMFVAPNHSYVHAWFTYRILGISLFAGMCALIEKFPQNKNGENIS